MADLANVLFCICFSPLFLRLTAPSDMGHLDPKATPGGSGTTGPGGGARPHHLSSCDLSAHVSGFGVPGFPEQVQMRSFPPRCHLCFTRLFHLRTFIFSSWTFWPSFVNCFLFLLLASSWHLPSPCSLSSSFVLLCTLFWWRRERDLPDSPHLVPALQAPWLPGSHLHST